MTGRPRGRPPVLSLDRIVDAALDLVDRTGSLSMVDLGAELGVDPSAVYHYVAGRAGLVSAVAERFTAPLLEPVPATDDWRADLEALLRRTEQLYRSRPAVGLLILAEADLTGAVLDVIGLGIDILRRSGATERDVFVTFHAVEIALAGAITYDLVGAPHDDEVRREYHRRIGRFDIDELYPTPSELAEESTSTAWILVRAALDRLESIVALGDAEA
ncbi:MAG: Tetracycline repressor protein [Actinomycetota bacterium]|jgi:AcrR family transcriptional regulator